MKKKVISGLTVFIIILSVFLLAKIILFSETVPQTQAQIANDNTNTVPDGNGGMDDGWPVVYILNPEPGPSIWGQREFHINIVPNNIASDIYVRVYKTYLVESAVGGNMDPVSCEPHLNYITGQICWDGYIREVDINEFGCELDFTGSEFGYWVGWCDTLELKDTDPNDTFDAIYFQIHALDDLGTEIGLAAGGDNKGNSNPDLNPLFGPFNIDNDYVFGIAGSSSLMSGFVDWEAYFTGDATSANISLVSNDSTTQPVRSITLEKVAGGAMSSYWELNDWDSTSLDNGSYTASLNFISLFNKARHQVSQLTLEIDNKDMECDPVWVCGDWSDCTSSGTQSRICEDTYCNQPSITETQECTPLTVEPEDDTTPLPSTEDDTTSPSEEDNIVSDPDLPTITMNYPQQGDVVSGEVTLKAVVEGDIQGLEFLYRPVQDGIEHHIGQASRSTTNTTVWQRSWNTDDVPNGDYYVFARVEDFIGRNFLSNYVPININHGQASLGDPVPEVEVPVDIVDSDDDGVSDNIEEQLGSDPYRPDSDSNDVTDAEEIINDLDPTSTGSLNDLVIEGKVTNEEVRQIKESLQKIVFEQPTSSGTLKPEKLKVARVENISPVIGQNHLVISGVGPPNTYLTLFIYSTPIVVTTKTDASGNFVYILDKNLLDGEHEVYVTVTDETGKIKEKSSPLTFFVRRAQAVTEEEYLRGDVNVQTESQETVNNYLVIVIIIVGGVLIILLVAYLVSRRRQNA